MLKRLLLLTFIGSLILAAMFTFSPKVAQASGGPPELAAVSAVSAHDVWAAGEVLTSSNVAEAIVEHWDGHSWQISPGATPTGVSFSALLGITALSHDNVWAVGDISTSSGSQSLIEHWDGSQWQVISNPVLSGTTNFLNAVSADSAHDVWAVGASDSSTLIEHWDGSSWSVVPGANPGSNGNELWGVSAISANDAWAVGDYRDSNFNELPLIEHWDGSSWSTVSSPNLSSFTTLRGISATSANNVWAVGSFFDSTDTNQALVEHWNGTSWEATIGLNPTGSPGSFFQGVTAVSRNNVWAVGGTNPPNTSGSLATLIEHWNGSSWQIIPSPNIADPNGSPLNFLNGVAAVPHDEDVWAVGRATDSSGSFVTLAEAWNGAHWSIVSSPNP